jgi:cephalosporin hydroxylase
MITIDLEEGIVTMKEGDSARSYAMATPEAFSIVSQAWLRCGWDNKYVYGFTWLGRPIIQLPEDLIRIQEVIYRLKPDVIIETGVAHGGSLVFYAGLCKIIGRGRVIGVDIEIRPHNRKAVESHELSELITLVEGSSVDVTTVAQVESLVRANGTVMVVLDSNHSKQHVLRELEAYAPLVSLGSYVVVTDGIMEELVNAPRSHPDWSWNNPQAAAREFLASHSNFTLAPPAFCFNEGNIRTAVTYWPGAWLQRIG